MKYHSSIGRALVKVAAEKLYAPDVLAHELGHSSLHGESGLLMPIRKAAPTLGSMINIITNKPYGLAGHLVPLADEAYASSKAMKTMRDWGVGEKDRRAARKRLGLGLASYAVGPAVDAGLTIGGMATGSRALSIAAPLAAGAVQRSVGPKIVRKMDEVPIKGITRGRAVELAKRTRPGVDVHFARTRLPGRGGFVNKPLVELSEEDVKHSPMYDELGAFIGHKASGKLLRKGGVVVSPID